MRGQFIWNLLGFALIGLSGLIMITAIARYYSEETLGEFNIIYSCYIVLSQLSGAGFHFSVLRYVSEHRGNKAICAKVLRTAILLSFLNACFWIAIFIASNSFILRLFQAKDLTLGLWCIFPALLFCSLNKIMLSFLNAYGKYTSLAIMNSLRGLSLILCIYIFIDLKYPGNILPAVISASELILFTIISLYLIPIFKIPSNESSFLWLKRHIIFGYQSMAGSIFIDINTRIDVLILGHYIPTSSVGIYSYAAILIDGFSQLSIVLRTLFNPKFTHAYFHESTQELQLLLRKLRNLSYFIQIPIGLLVVALFIPTINFLGLNQSYNGSFEPFAILMGGLLLAVGYAPLLMLFNQVGMPGQQSKLYIYIFLSNLVFNLALVPNYGLYGAAYGTALSYLTTMLVIRQMSRRQLGLKI